MNRIKNVAIISGLVTAFTCTWLALDTAAQPQPDATRSAAREVRIGMVDVYLVSERIMQQDEKRKAREQADEPFDQRIKTIADEARVMETQLQVLPQTDPQVQQIMERYQALQVDYERIEQERRRELERINSRQLIEAFEQARATAATVARAKGYSHIFANRQFDRPIETLTVGATLQEMLARPIIVGIPTDDLTDAVIAELRLTEPSPQAPGTGQDGAPPNRNSPPAR